MTDLFEAEATTTTSLDMRRLQRQQRRATRRKWTLVVSAVAVVLLAIGGSIAYNFVMSFESDSTDVAADFEGAGQGVVQVVVERGDTGSDIAQTLYEAGVVASPEAFITEARSNPDAAGITPGYYFMQREMKAEFALLALLDPRNRNELTLTIPEGYRVEQYYQAIANLTDATVEEVEAAAKDTDALGLPEQADGNLEGWLFPLTYRFDPDSQPADILAEMIQTTIQVLDRNDVPEGDRERILTIASLIEREARLDEDRAMISGVLQNRLDIDMALELDSTVKYLNPTEGVFTTEEDRAIDSPYNTYMYTGLPPSPIAAPGEASIIAAMNPADHDYLFFVTVNTDTGETKYGETYEEHQVNVAELREWAQARAAEDEDAEGEDG